MKGFQPFLNIALSLFIIIVNMTIIINTYLVGANKQMMAAGNGAFVIGVDFGTDSVRAVLVNAADGTEVSSASFLYPRWKTGLYCDPSKNQFRQHPLDYIEGIESTIRECLQTADKIHSGIARRVKAISVDTTGSSPMAVDSSGTPLALLPGLRGNPNAMTVIWKDHSSIKEAEAINLHARKFPMNYLQFVGGIYSSEWFWAKLLHILREDEQIRANIYSWVEHCDWIPFLLTGGTQASEIKRGICAAGHKALWSESWNGLPPNEFFRTLDPLLDDFTKKLFDQTYTSAESAGTISTEWAERLGLNESVVIGIGAFDAHMGAVGGQIEPYHLSRVMGTSTCDILVVPQDDAKNILIKGICGQVPGSVIPGMTGMEAGQSAFGDAYAWFRNILMWPIQFAITDPMQRETINDNLIDALSVAAEKIQASENSELAIDWLNGRRTPDANQNLKGAIANLNLATDAPKIFRAIVESTCFGARAIVDRFLEEGIPVKGLIGLGGVARKSPFIMQMLADIIGMPIRIHRSEQTCAMGAAMFAATAAGLYEKVEDAMQAMGQGFDREYFPDPDKKKIYDDRYEKYRMLGQSIEKLNP
jgi:L-ribulokinase